MYSRHSRFRPPRVYRILRRQAVRIRRSPTGDVGRLFQGSGIELVWVSKRAERIDENWFHQPMVDLLLVVRGRLRVEFKDRRFTTRVLGEGDLLVLPPDTFCRAYRWPRTSRKATVFLAAYPSKLRSLPGHRRPHHRI